MIAVTGARGFLGSDMVPFLEREGHCVRRVTADLCDPRNVEGQLDGCDCVVHLAARMGGIGFHSTSQFQPALNNMLLDMNVLSWCSRNQVRLLYASSACALPVYAMNEGKPLSEDMLSWPADPDQMYGLEKYFVTRLAEHADFDLRVVLLHTIYGEGQEYATKKAKFPPAICYKFAKPDSIEVWGDGSQTRTFLHVDDAMRMMNAVLRAESYEGPVNISSPDEVSVRQVVEILSEHTGRQDYRYVTDAPVGPSRRGVDMRLFYERYAERPTVLLKEGMLRLFKWIQADMVSGESDNKAIVK